MLQIIADELKQARIKKDISIKQISIKTRIEQKYLENIEDGNFSFMPELYVKAFIREFAESVDLNSEKIIQRYELAKKGINPDSVEQNEPVRKQNITKEIEEDKPKLKEPVYVSPSQNKKIIDAYELEPTTSNKNKATDNNKLILIGGAVLLILFIIIYFLFIKEKNTEIITERPFDEILEEEKTRFVETPEEKLYETGDSLSLLVKGISVSWVQSVIDDKDTIEFTLYEGITRELKAADNFKLKIGNSAGVTIESNGKPLSIEGRPNQVANIKIDKNGLQNIR